MRRKEYPTIDENIQSLIRMFGPQPFVEHLIRQIGVEQLEQLIQQVAQQNDGKGGKKEMSKKK